MSVRLRNVLVLLLSVAVAAAGLFAIDVSNAQTAPAAVRYEAESAVLAGGVVAESSVCPCSGGGSVGWWSWGGTVTFTVNAPVAGVYSVAMRYGMPDAGPVVRSVSVNGVSGGNLSFPKSGPSWSDWAMLSSSWSLSAGVNTVVLAAPSGGYLNLDYIDLIAPSGVATTTTVVAPPTTTTVPSSSAVRYEAESAVLAGGVVVETTHCPCSGSGSVGYWGLGGSLTFTINAPVSGNYSVAFRYASPDPNPILRSVTVNGTAGASLSFPQSGSTWASWATFTTQLSLPAGSNTVVLAAPSGGNLNLDYIDVTTPSIPTTTRPGSPQACSFCGGFEGGTAAPWSAGPSSVLTVLGPSNPTRRGGSYAAQVTAAPATPTANRCATFTYTSSLVVEDRALSVWATGLGGDTALTTLLQPTLNGTAESPSTSSTQSLSAAWSLLEVVMNKPATANGATVTLCAPTDFILDDWLVGNSSGRPPAPQAGGGQTDCGTGFEDTQNGWSGNNGTATSVITTNPAQGTKALALRPPSGATVSGTGSFRSFGCTLIEGRGYSANVKMRATAASTPVSLAVGSAGGVSGSGTETIGTDWRDVSIAFTATGEDTITITSSTAGAGIDLDDVRILPSRPAAPQAAVTDANGFARVFDTGFSNGFGVSQLIAGTWTAVQPAITGGRTDATGLLLGTSPRTRIVGAVTNGGTATDFWVKGDAGATWTFSVAEERLASRVITTTGAWQHILVMNAFAVSPNGFVSYEFLRTAGTGTIAVDDMAVISAAAPTVDPAPGTNFAQLTQPIGFIVNGLWPAHTYRVWLYKNNTPDTCNAPCQKYPVTNGQTVQLPNPGIGIYAVVLESATTGDTIVLSDNFSISAPPTTTTTTIPPTTTTPPTTVPPTTPTTLPPPTIPPTTIPPPPPPPEADWSNRADNYLKNRYSNSCLIQSVYFVGPCGSGADQITLQTGFRTGDPAEVRIKAGDQCLHMVADRAGFDGVWQKQKVEWEPCDQYNLYQLFYRSNGPGSTYSNDWWNLMPKERGIQPGDSQYLDFDACLNYNTGGGNRVVIAYQCQNQGDVWQDHWQPKFTGGSPPDVGVELPTGAHLLQDNWPTPLEQNVNGQLSCVAENGSGYQLVAEPSNACVVVIPRLAPGGYYLEHLDSPGACIGLAATSFAVRTTCTAGAIWTDQTKAADGVRFPLRPMKSAGSAEADDSRCLSYNGSNQIYLDYNCRKAPGVELQTRQLWIDGPHTAAYVSESDAVGWAVASQLAGQTGDPGTDAQFGNWILNILRQPNGRKILQTWDAYRGPLPRYSNLWKATPREQSDGLWTIDAFSYFTRLKLKSLVGDRWSSTVYDAFALRDIGDSPLDQADKLNAWDTVSTYLSTAADHDIEANGGAYLDTLVANAIQEAQYREGSLTLAYIAVNGPAGAPYLCNHPAACDQARAALTSGVPTNDAVAIGFTYCLFNRPACVRSDSWVAAVSFIGFFGALYVPTVLDRVRSVRESATSGIEGKTPSGGAATSNPAPSTTRSPLDIAAQTNNPTPPADTQNSRGIGRASHRAWVSAKVLQLTNAGSFDIRVNQQQVNFNRTRVGINRPDIQYSLGGVRYYIEVEGPSNPRGAAHEARIVANDPSAAAAGRVTVVQVP